MKETKKCPVCGRSYCGYPAISRKDNETEICPLCGEKEAMDAFNKYMRKVQLGIIKDE